MKKTMKKQTKILLLLGFIPHILYTYYLAQERNYMISQYGLDVYLGRITGEASAPFVFIILVSATISSIPYFIFRKKSQKDKKFLDYFVIVFLITSLIVTFSTYKSLEFQKTIGIF